MTIPAKQPRYPFAESVGAAIRDAKRRLRLTDKKLAERADVSRRHLAELQKGSNVTLLVAQKVMRAIGMTELLLGEEERLVAPKPQGHPAALAAATEQVELAAALLLHAAATMKSGSPLASSGVDSALGARVSRVIDDFADYLRTLDSAEKVKAAEELWQACVAQLRAEPAGRQRKKRKRGSGSGKS